MTGIEHKPTFCRICEPLCGMIATVEDGKLIALRPDKDHPVSQGFACPKGIAFADLHNDPDRVTTPLRKGCDGGFEPVSWDEAMTDIAARLDAIHRRHGAGAIGWYFGNPGAFSAARGGPRVRSRPCGRHDRSLETRRAAAGSDARSHWRARPRSGRRGRAWRAA